MNDSGLLTLIILFLTLDILLLRNLETMLLSFLGRWMLLIFICRLINKSQIWRWNHQSGVASS